MFFDAAMSAMDASNRLIAREQANRKKSRRFAWSVQAVLSIGYGIRCALESRASSMFYEACCSGVAVVKPFVDVVNDKPSSVPVVLKQTTQSSTEDAGGSNE